ncbi:MAG TPA: sugar transferase [Paracoccaceae bacterium]|nr:sugar transferase [Paracoccaceae bacterium]
MTINSPQFVPRFSGEKRAVELRGGAMRGLYASVFKRALDVVAVVLAAPFVLPLVGAMALAVRRDGGPAFYGQDRVGRHGRTFRMWKLRSMVPDADAVFESHLNSNPAARVEWDHTQKLRDDPRITPLGRFLRRSSLDELPQLWNVLRGDMSLVGPRPMMTNQRPLYPGSAYYRLLPGLTGPWQVAGRSETSFAARADFDADYERDLSLATDLRLILRTVAVVLKGTGC